MIDLTILPCPLGDYMLVRLLASTRETLTFAARQESIKRDVLLTVLRPEEYSDSEKIESFLASIRIKAGVTSPFICAMYEAATSEDGLPYYTQEHPGTATLEDKLAAGEKWEPLAIAEMLLDIAKAEQYCWEKSCALDPWSPLCVILHEGHDTHLINLAREGTPTEEDRQRDFATMAHVIHLLVKPATPGYNRIMTLAQWLKGGSDAPIGLDWAQVVELLETIISQLKAGGDFVTVAHRGEMSLRRRGKRWTLQRILGLAVVVSSIISLCFILAHRTGSSPDNPALKGSSASSSASTPSTPSEGKTGDLGAPVDVADTTTPPDDFDDASLPEREEVTLMLKDPETGRESEYSVDRFEVTIASYEQFLNFFNKLSESERKLYRVPDQPEDKVSHEPDGWIEVQDALASGKPWRGYPMTSRHPVTNVDYWDACVYAQWAGRRLPTLAEWRAIIADASAIRPDKDFISVYRYQNDKDERSLAGLASGVTEWTSTKAVDPAIPMGGKKRVLVGGSHINREGVEHEEYIGSDELRRIDLGFRTLKEKGE